jgi:hypothetical protein
MIHALYKPGFWLPLKHEFALTRQDDVLIHYLPNLTPGEHITIDKERFFYDLNYTKAYLFQLVIIAQDIKFCYYIRDVSKVHGTESHSISHSPEHQVMIAYQMILDLDSILGKENKLPDLTTLMLYTPPS